MIQEIDGRQYQCLIKDPDGNALPPDDENESTMKIFEHLTLALHGAGGGYVEIVYLDNVVRKPWKFCVEVV